MELIYKWFKATEKRDGLLDVTAEDLKKLGVKGIALDADNTSSYDRTTTPIPGAKEWVDGMKSAGFKLVLLSNGREKRAKILADQYGIPVIGLCCKPLPFGYWRAVVKLRIRPSKFVMVGDQLFTDIWGANMWGFKSIWCKPVGKDRKQKLGFAIKRFIEKLVAFYIDRTYDGHLEVEK